MKRRCTDRDIHCLIQKQNHEENEKLWQEIKTKLQFEKQTEETSNTIRENKLKK